MTKRPYAKTDLNQLFTIYLAMTATRVALVNEDKRLWRTLYNRTRDIEREMIERGVSIPSTVEGPADLFTAAGRAAGELHRKHLASRVMSAD
jgi:hypothetical protein